MVNNRDRATYLVVRQIELRRHPQRPRHNLENVSQSFQVPQYESTISLCLAFAIFGSLE